MVLFARHGGRLANYGICGSLVRSVQCVPLISQPYGDVFLDKLKLSLGTRAQNEDFTIMDYCRIFSPPGRVFSPFFVLLSCLFQGVVFNEFPC